MPISTGKASFAMKLMMTLIYFIPLFLFRVKIEAKFVLLHNS